ncbi:hypothetical protein OG846_00095 [Streptomyces sp. NBC_01601]
MQWSFTPDGDSRYADLQPASSFTYVSEAKARTSGGSTLVLVTASYGFAAVVEYPTGKRRWAGLVAGSGPGDDLNPHGIELLPDGNVAVACSRGNTVRVYAASQGPTATCDVPVWCRWVGVSDGTSELGVFAGGVLSKGGVTAVGRYVRRPRLSWGGTSHSAPLS